MDEAKTNPLRSTILSGLRQYSMLIALLVVMIIFQFTTNGILLVPQNVSNLILQNAYVVVLAVGMLLCILTGGNIDLSVGSVVGLIGAVAGTLIIEKKMHPVLGIAIALLVGIIIGMWHGMWIAYVKIPPFIVTLTGMLIFRGLTQVVLNGMTLSGFPDLYLAMNKYIPDAFNPENVPGRINVTCLLVGFLAVVVFISTQIFGRIRKMKKGYETENIIAFIVKLVLVTVAIVLVSFSLASYNGVPNVLVLLAIIVLIYAYITNKTVAGRYLYALGGNEKAARLSGIDTRKVYFLAYTNMSFLAAVAGIVFSARLTSASPDAGDGFELDAIGSCFIGGASAYGGIGTVGGVLIGAAFMGVLNNGMIIMGVPVDWQKVVKGMVLLLAVAFDVVSKRKK
jgi:putative multiple sugar transport system permease protein